ncbi:hypothetical protein FIA58_016870 [Flavobacterium jejuense]|uniref:Uncharacterized protein n=1 Tax=Flavobacterium jejuense TaxID=1544455 RepID=A0ABX0IZD5_9FLAO|nr:hypothetical protein [Flavobacterium jejuense]NHN27356.1 hypothetical protein [Flavobacterium jejuense]
MKTITTAAALALLISCKSVNDKSKKTDQKTTILDKSSLSCPEDGICKIELLKNRSLLIKKDDINSIYYQTTENKDHSIIKYTYTKNKEKGAEDINYTEEVIFQISNSNSNLELSNSELQNIKIIFGRHCYCKGQAGYFLIDNGDLILIKRNEKYNLILNFTISEVPQIINTIEASFQ